MIEAGAVLEGRVTGVTTFGAFVDLGGRQSGLVHISEISSSYVENVNDCVKKGDIVRVKVLGIDERGRISLSMKRAEPEKGKKLIKEREKSEKRIRPDDFEWNVSNDSELSLEEKISKFKKISDENINSLRRSAAGKRSGGYSRKGNY